MTRGPGLSLAADGTSRAALARNRGPGTGHAEYTFLGRCICAHSQKPWEWEGQKSLRNIAKRVQVYIANNKKQIKQRGDIQCRQQGRKQMQ